MHLYPLCFKLHIHMYMYIQLHSSACIRGNLVFDLKSLKNLPQYHFDVRTYKAGRIVLVLCFFHI